MYHPNAVFGIIALEPGYRNESSKAATRRVAFEKGIKGDRRDVF
jgi:hypothetical protein